eukprot:gene19806-26488_t
MLQVPGNTAPPPVAALLATPSQAQPRGQPYTQLNPQALVPSSLASSQLYRHSSRGPSPTVQAKAGKAGKASAKGVSVPSDSHLPAIKTRLSTESKPSAPHPPTIPQEEEEEEGGGYSDGDYEADQSALASEQSAKAAKQSALAAEQSTLAAEQSTLAAEQQALAAEQREAEAYAEDEYEEEYGEDFDNEVILGTEVEIEDETAPMRSPLVLAFAEDSEPEDGPTTPLPVNRPRASRRRDCGGLTDGPRTPMPDRPSGSRRSDLDQHLSLGEVAGPSGHAPSLDFEPRPFDEEPLEEEEEVAMFFIDAGKSITDVKVEGEAASPLPLWAADLPLPGAVMADAELLAMPEVSIVGGAEGNDVDGGGGKGGGGGGVEAGGKQVNSLSMGDEAGEMSFEVDVAQEPGELSLFGMMDRAASSATQVAPIAEEEEIPDEIDLSPK